MDGAKDLTALSSESVGGGILDKGLINGLYLLLGINPEDEVGLLLCDGKDAKDDQPQPAHLSSSRGQIRRTY
ncbi:hypothetical protein ACHAWF_008252 [Thalassiosira exigua]